MTFIPIYLFSHLEIISDINHLEISEQLIIVVCNVNYIQGLNLPVTQIQLCLCLTDSITQCCWLPPHAQWDTVGVRVPQSGPLNPVSSHNGNMYHFHGLPRPPLPLICCKSDLPALLASFRSVPFRKVSLAMFHAWCCIFLAKSARVLPNLV